jgi:hypothetical protein
MANFAVSFSSNKCYSHTMRSTSHTFYFKNRVFIFLLFLVLPSIALAHQPRIVNSSPTIVENPQISKAYDDTLTGQPHTYIITSATPFALYVNVLVPDIAGQEKDISASITKDGSTTPIATLDGVTYEWKKFYEPFGGDTYWMGPEYKAPVQAGTYTVTVSSSKNNSEYSLAIGETEAFDLNETISAIHAIPLIKQDFFKESPATFIFSVFGAAYLVILFILAFVFGFLYRLALRLLIKNPTYAAKTNIGTQDRLIRVAIGVALLLWGITTNWNPLILFFAGFAFFEALFSWCAFNAAIGENTCSD